MFSYDIIQLNNEQITNLTQYADLLRVFQRAVVNNDLEDLQRIIDKQEKLIIHINECEKNRASVIKAALEELGIELTASNFMDLLEQKISNINLALGKKISLSRKLLIEKINEINLLDIQNNILITNSRIFIKEFLKNILGNKRENFLDKKA